MKKITLFFVLALSLSACKQKDPEDGSATPMIERKHSYMQKTQEENLKDVDTTDDEEENFWVMEEVH